MTSDGQPAEQEDDGASTVEEESGGGGGEGVGTLDEARRLIRELRERHRAQARQLLTWKRRVKSQEELVSQVARERNDQLRSVSSQLLLLEARLCRKQREIGVLLAERDAVIVRQQRTIKRLQSRLCEAGVECAEEANADSLNDSDSAVIMEDDDVVMRQGVGDGGGVARSVSDAKWAARRNNGLLRRPDVLETVYSVEEDADADADQPPVDSGMEEPGWHAHRGRLKELYGSFERLDRDADADAEPPPPPPPNHVTTYNRVMSNHRSVTKPKDVKYKRINKAKSKSLEELRGRLKNWVDKGNKIAISLDQSCN